MQKRGKGRGELQIRGNKGKQSDLYTWARTLPVTGVNNNAFSNDETTANKSVRLE
jgi:hypothetical protein